MNNDFNYLMPSPIVQQRANAAGVVIANLVRVINDKLVKATGDKFGFQRLYYRVQEAYGLVPYQAVTIVTQADGSYVHMMNIEPSDRKYPGKVLNTRILADGDASFEINVGGYDPVTVWFNKDPLGNFVEDDLQTQMFPLAGRIVDDLWSNLGLMKTVQQGQEVVDRFDNGFSWAAKQKLQGQVNVLKAAIDT